MAHRVGIDVVRQFGVFISHDVNQRLDEAMLDCLFQRLEGRATDSVEPLGPLVVTRLDPCLPELSVNRSLSRFQPACTRLSRFVSISAGRTQGGKRRHAVTFG